MTDELEPLFQDDLLLVMGNQTALIRRLEKTIEALRMRIRELEERPAAIDLEAQKDLERVDGAKVGG